MQIKVSQGGGEGGAAVSAAHPGNIYPYLTRRLNMALDLQSLFGLLCTAVLIG
jgi:hypothetical protein